MILERGSIGTGVAVLERALESAGYYNGPFEEPEASAVFGTGVERAVRRFQESRGLRVDGRVGIDPDGETMRALRSDATTVPPDTDPAPLPVPPLGLHPLSLAERERLFGHFDFVPDPRPLNPEGIKILGGWQAGNIVRAEVPQLARIAGGPPSGNTFSHRIAEEPLKRLFQAWDDAGLLDRARTWGGLWNPRYIRGSRTTLSNHAWATAFDINAQWNSLGQAPAPLGTNGSLVELVPLAAEHGWYWGGWYRGRIDGMHFELVCI